MPVPTNITDLDTTASLNSPQGSESPKGTIDDYIRALSAFIRQLYNSVAQKAPLADPTFTGVPSAPTASAGTNTTQIATTAFVLANTPTPKAIAAGTADAITGAFTPAITALTAGLTVLVRAASGNNSNATTFKADSTAAKTIVKGNNIALSTGDIVGAGHWLEMQYDATLDKWVLQNPAAGVMRMTRTMFATCSTASATAAKDITYIGFSVADGDVLFVNFTYTNSHATPTLTINGSSYTVVLPNGSAPDTNNPAYFPSGRWCRFIYRYGVGFVLLIDTVESKQAVSGGVTSWWKIQSNGWVEQGARNSSLTAGTNDWTHTLPVPLNGVPVEHSRSINSGSAVASVGNKYWISFSAISATNVTVSYDGTNSTAQAYTVKGWIAP